MVVWLIVTFFTSSLALAWSFWSNRSVLSSLLNPVFEEAETIARGRTRTCFTSCSADRDVLCCAAAVGQGNNDLWKIHFVWFFSLLLLLFSRALLFYSPTARSRSRCCRPLLLLRTNEPSTTPRHNYSFLLILLRVWTTDDDDVLPLPPVNIRTITMPWNMLLFSFDEATDISWDGPDIRIWIWASEWVSKNWKSKRVSERDDGQTRYQDLLQWKRTTIKVRIKNRPPPQKSPEDSLAVYSTLSICLSRLVQDVKREEFCDGSGGLVQR